MIKTVVGSYPVVKGAPQNIIDKIKNKLGMFDEFKYAIEQSIYGQLDAGIDILSDGQTRGDMVEIFVSNLYGFEGKRVVGKIEHTKPITLNDIKYSNKILKSLPNTQNKSIKGLLTGPCTIASSIRIENNTHYSDNKDENLIYDLANALKKEAEAIQNNVSTIQIDEPILSTGMYDLDMAKQAINLITEDLKVPISMHVCGDALGVYSELHNFNVDMLDFEFASNKKNLEVLEDINKKIGFGSINTKLKTVESVDNVKSLIREGVEILKNNPKFNNINGNINDKLNNFVVIDPDCGMRLLPLNIAQQKLKNMCIACDEFENEIKE